MSKTVPFIGPRSRYSLVGVSPSWLVQKMEASTQMDGGLPETASIEPADLDPQDITPGRALWKDLIKGGLFAIGNLNKAIVVEEIDTKEATFTITVTDKAGVFIRNQPASFPFKLAPGESLKATTTGATTNGAEMGICVRIDGFLTF